MLGHHAAHAQVWDVIFLPTESWFCGALWTSILPALLARSLTIFSRLSCFLSHHMTDTTFQLPAFCWHIIVSRNKSVLLTAFVRLGTVCIG